MRKVKKYNFLFLSMSILCPLFASSQLYNVQISTTGNVTIENPPLTSCLCLPFYEALTMFTTNTPKLNRIPQDSLREDSAGKYTCLISDYSFDEVIYRNYGVSKRDDAGSFKGNEISYFYSGNFGKGCSGYGSYKYFNLLLKFQKNKLETVCWQITDDWPKPRKYIDTATFKYNSLGNIKTINMPLGESYIFYYDKKEHLTNIEKRYSRIKNIAGQDSSRIIYGSYKFGDNEFIFNESINKYSYYSLFEETIPTRSQMKKYYDLRQKVVLLNKEINIARRIIGGKKDNFTQRKLNRMYNQDHRFRKRVMKYQKKLPSAALLYHKQYDNGKLVRIDEVDLNKSYYDDSYTIIDSFFYDNKKRLKKHVYYTYGRYKMKPECTSDYEYNTVNQLSQLTTFEETLTEKRKTYLLKYYYDISERISMIEQVQFYYNVNSEHSHNYHFYY